ncbi:MAG: hypothetical protein VX689_00560 [Bacteroidota bacterium]|nr:hypothetical protein [Bacteroidota bacterium]
MMNNINFKIGVSSSVIISLGCLLKAFHFPGAAMVLTSGFLFFSLIFMPGIIFGQLKDKKILYAILGFFLSALILGVLFKIMYWRGANFLISWSITISLFGIMPIYFIDSYISKRNNSLTEEDYMKKILIGVFILAFLSLWYALIDISKIPNPYSIP